MTLASWFAAFFGVDSLFKGPLSPARLYTILLAGFKSQALLVPILSVINAPHGRFGFDSLLNVNGNLFWFLMEVPSPTIFLLSVCSPVLSTSSSGSGSTFLSLSSLLSPSLSNFLTLPSANKVLVALYLTHYVHRAVLQPLRSPPRSPMHISVPLSALVFNTVNGFLMGSWIGGRTPWVSLPEAARSSALTSAVKLPQGLAKTVVASALGRKVSGANVVNGLGLPRPGLVPESAWNNPLWYLGLVGWLVGFAGNVYHDEVLMNLRRPTKTNVGQTRNPDQHNGQQTTPDTDKNYPKYKIPYGGLYRYISYPNYLCEWFEWFCYSLAALHSLSLFSNQSVTSLDGFKQVVMTLFSTPPLVFAFVEVCVMLPRAINGHKWYKKTFGDRYPQERKAVLPGLL